MKPFMSNEEIEFLDRSLSPRDRVWEWGSGSSTLWLSERCKRVTSVEHKRHFAANVIAAAPANLSLLYVPVDATYIEGTEDDGDLQTFRHYVQCYNGGDIDVVLFDGRARVACAQQVAEHSTFGPHPGMKFFLHDCDRAQYDPIWRDDEAKGWRAWFDPVERVGSLLLMKWRQP